MARKLRLFKEQMAKAGISPSTTHMTRNHVDLDDLEVCIVDNLITGYFLFSFFKLLLLSWYFFLMLNAYGS